MPNGTAWAREYEALAAVATTLPELRNLSLRYLGKQREELVSKLERARAEVNRRKLEAERAQQEAERTSSTLERISCELEARAPRLARADLEELRACVRRGLTRSGSAVPLRAGQSADPPPAAVLSAGPSPPAVEAAPPSASSAALLRLRARVEQLEKTQARLRRENEQLRFGSQKETVASQPTTSRLWSPRASPRSSPRSLNRSQATIGVEGGAPGVVAASGTPATKVAGKEAIEKRGLCPAEKEQLLATIQTLEKELADQKHYSDRVEIELSQALRSIETENGSLKAELWQGGLRNFREVEMRRELEQQVNQLRAENEELMQQVVMMQMPQEYPEHFQSLPQPPLNDSAFPSVGHDQFPAMTLPQQMEDQGEFSNRTGQTDGEASASSSVSAGQEVEASLSSIRSGPPATALSWMSSNLSRSVGRGRLDMTPPFIQPAPLPASFSAQD
mmetsp:Transcript_23643/g.52426  ORF Transcript_23643/g.52426 Transcript_23643/m.52426 type:complete len:450 (-) Transcript_23643:107-1456(-)